MSVFVRTALLIGVAVTLACIAAGCGAQTQAVATVVAEPATDVNGYGCLKSELDHHRRCPANPAFGKTRAQLRQEAYTAKVAARRARIEARREEKARQAQIAAENAWHKGYYQQDDNVFWRWRDGLGCKDDYLENGCWRVEVITRDGCDSYVAVNANEYQGHTIINQLLDNQGYGIPAKTPRLFELDADEGRVSVGDVTIDCV